MRVDISIKKQKIIIRVDDLKDWVRVKASASSMSYGWEDITLNSNGVIHNVDKDGDVGIDFFSRSKPFSFKPFNIMPFLDIDKVVLFHEGQEIHIIPSITQPRLGWSNEIPETIGKIMRVNMDMYLSAHVNGTQTSWKVSSEDAELLSVCEVSDWVRSKPSLGSRPSYGWFSVGRDSIVVEDIIQEASYLEMACFFRRGRWSTNCRDFENILVSKIEEFVHFQKSLTEPKWGRRGAKPDSRGIISTESGSTFTDCPWAQCLCLEPEDHSQD